MIFPYHSQQGFTLVETLVAITILLIVITGPLTISTSAARSTSFSSEQVVAFFLAQEGAEIMQKARDDVLIRQFIDPADSGYAANYVANPWGEVMNPSGIYEHCFSSDGCRLMLSATGEVIAPIRCGSNQNCDLYFDSNTNTHVRSKYTHVPAGNVATPFTRVIKLTQTPRDVKIESIVTWRTGGQREVQEVKVETYLYDIY